MNSSQELHPREYVTWYKAVEKAMDFLGYTIDEERNFTIARPSWAPPAPPAPGVVRPRKKLALEKWLGRNVPYTYGR